MNTSLYLKKGIFDEIKFAESEILSTDLNFPHSNKYHCENIVVYFRIQFATGCELIRLARSLKLSRSNL